MKMINNLKTNFKKGLLFLIPIIILCAFFLLNMESVPEVFAQTSETVDISLENVSISKGSGNNLLLNANGIQKEIAENTIIIITGSTTTNGVVVDGVSAEIAVSDLSISLLADNAGAFQLINSASVSLKVQGKNFISSGIYKAGIEVEAGNAITINADSLASTLVVGSKVVYYDVSNTYGTSGSYGAGIGGSAHVTTAGDYAGADAGTIVINGGTISPMSQYGAGIGGGGTLFSKKRIFTADQTAVFKAGDGGNITINGGKINLPYSVYATGAAIGGGGIKSEAGVDGSSVDKISVLGGAGGNITINDGEFFSKTGGVGAAIGGGGVDGFAFYAYQGTANEFFAAAGDSGVIIVNGGKISATNLSGAVIGGGSLNVRNYCQKSSTIGKAVIKAGSVNSITINGGTVMGESGSYAAFIGGGGIYSESATTGTPVGVVTDGVYLYGGDGGKIIINAGTITGKSSFLGAGIGGGGTNETQTRGLRITKDVGGNGGEIKITGGNIDIVSAQGAGIGGGKGSITGGQGGDVTILGGVIKVASESGAGIGGGAGYMFGGDGGTLNIFDCESIDVKAKYAPATGGGVFYYNSSTDPDAPLPYGEGGAGYIGPDVSDAQLSFVGFEKIEKNEHAFMNVNREVYVTFKVVDENDVPLNHVILSSDSFPRDIFTDENGEVTVVISTFIEYTIKFSDVGYENEVKMIVVEKPENISMKLKKETPTTTQSTATVSTLTTRTSSETGGTSSTSTLGGGTVATTGTTIPPSTGEIVRNLLILVAVMFFSGLAIWIFHKKKNRIS